MIKKGGGAEGGGRKPVFLPVVGVVVERIQQGMREAILSTPGPSRQGSLFQSRFVAKSGRKERRLYIAGERVTGASRRQQPMANGSWGKGFGIALCE